MTPKVLELAQNSRAKLKEGFRKVAEPVSATLGPKGRNIIIGNDWGNPTPTKDGVTVAREIILKDTGENIGAQLIKQVAGKTNDVAGDGTTTATVLAYAMVDSGDKFLNKKVNVTSLKNGIDKGVQKVFEHLSDQTEIVDISNIEKIESVATISGNDAAVGKLVAEAYTKVDVNGTVTLHPNNMPWDELEVKEGFKFERGYVSPYFITDQDTMRAEYVEPLILVWEKRIEQATEMLKFLQSVVSTGKPLVIISDDTTSDALSTLVVNKMKNVLPVVCIKAPEYGDMRKEVLKDIAVLTGATFFGEELGAKLDRVPLSALGTCDKIVVTAGETTIINGGGDKEKLADHIAMLNSLLSNKEYDGDIDKVKSRLSRLNGKAVFIKI